MSKAGQCQGSALCHRLPAWLWHLSASLRLNFHVINPLAVKALKILGRGAPLYTGLFSPSAVQLGVSPGSGDFRNKCEERTSQLWKHLPGLPVMYLPASKTFQKSVKYNTLLWFFSSITTLIGCPSCADSTGAGGVLIIPFVYGIRLRLLLISLFLFATCLPHQDSNCGRQVGDQSTELNVQNCKRKAPIFQAAGVLLLHLDY